MLKGAGANLFALALFLIAEEIPAEILAIKKLTSFDRCAARGMVVAALQPARAQSVRLNTHFFIV